MQRSARPSACSSSSRVNSRSVMSRWSMPEDPRRTARCTRAADAAAAGVRELEARVDGGVEDVLVLGALHDSLLAVRAEEGDLHLVARAGAELAAGGRESDGGEGERDTSGSGRREGTEGRPRRERARRGSRRFPFVSCRGPRFAFRRRGTHRLLRSMEVRANLSEAETTRRAARSFARRPGAAARTATPANEAAAETADMGCDRARLSVILSRRIRAGDLRGNGRP